MNKNSLLKVGGSVVTLLSGMTLAGYVASGKKKEISPLIPVAGVAGLLTGTAMIIYPHLHAKKDHAKPEDDLMDEDDIALIRQNINEVLGGE